MAMSIILFFFICNLFVKKVFSQSCSTGTVYNGYCWKVYSTLMNFVEAEMYCRSEFHETAHLASFRTASELDYFFPPGGSFNGQIDDNDNHWIGLNEIVSETYTNENDSGQSYPDNIIWENFEYTDGTPYDTSFFSKWRIDQPNDNEGGAHGVAWLRDVGLNDEIHTIDYKVLCNYEICDPMPCPKNPWDNVIWDPSAREVSCDWENVACPDKYSFGRAKCGENWEKKGNCSTDDITGSTLTSSTEASIIVSSIFTSIFFILSICTIVLGLVICYKEWKKRTGGLKFESKNLNFEEVTKVTTTKVLGSESVEDIMEPIATLLYEDDYADF